MSFLNSVLNSIGSRNHQSSLLRPDVTQPSDVTQDRGSPVNPRAVQDKSERAQQQSEFPASNKRAAEDTLSQPSKKVAKNSRDAPSSVGLGGPAASKPLTADGKVSTSSKIHSSTASGINSRPKHMPGALGSLATPTQVIKAELSSAPKKEPKKGSYAEIMARAKANQAKPLVVGTISHKPKEKTALTHKQESKLRKRAERDRRLGIVKDNGRSRPSSAEEETKLGKAGSKSVKPPLMTRIKKPKPQPVYKGTMHPVSVTVKGKDKAPVQSKRRGNEYAGTDDDLDDEDDLEEDDGYGYDDEESDDMEAGFLDVQEEETAAERAARMEDEQEARLEAKLKGEKEERKRKMEDLVKKAKPQRY